MTNAITGMGGAGSLHGKRFGPYEALEKVGHGAAAVVYRGRHADTGDVVALKVVTDASLADPTQLRRFRREFEIARRLNHPCLVRALDYGEHGDHLYQALEFVEGRSLDKRIREQGPLALLDAIGIFRQVAGALQYLHDRGVVHRDVKPGNILLAADGVAKLTDLGLLKRTIGQTSVLTRSRQGLGTIAYGAPEQFEDAKRIDHRCDLYSLAATFYSGVTGELPFGSGGHLKILRRKLLNQFVPLVELVKDVDADLNDYISRALSAAPVDRPNSCIELVRCLDRQKATLTRPTPTPKSEASADGGKNRRRADRKPVDLAATCEPMFSKSRENWTAAIVDLSRNGLCLRTTSSFPVDTILQVQLQTADQTADAWHLVRVRWTKPSPRKTWNIGCVLLHPLTAARFEAIQAAGAPTQVSVQANEAMATASA